MYKLLAALIAGVFLCSYWLVFPGPDEVPIDRAPAAKTEQTKNETAYKVRVANKEEASQYQPSPSPRNAAFIVFVSLLFGRK